MENDGSKFEQYERPFKPEEHGFVNNNVYILKPALRRRLTQIDPKWRTSDPEIMATAGDVVLMRGCLILEGASRTAVGTGIIISTKKNDKTGEHEPLPPFEYARNLAKAYKTAASDLLPRLCMEYNIGAYLKSMPKTVRDMESLTKWLASLSPKKEQPKSSVTPPPAAPAAPKSASCLSADPECKSRFTALLKELNITNDKPYLDELLIDRYSEYPGTFDELCSDMRGLHEAFFAPPVRGGSVNVTEATIEDRTAVFTTKDVTLRVLIKNLIAMLQPNGDARDNKKQERWLESVQPGLWLDGASVTFPELRLWFQPLREAGNTLHVSSVDVAVDIPPINGGTPASAATFPPANGGSEALASPATQSNGTPATPAPVSPFRDAGRFQKPLDGLRALNSAERKAAAKDLEA
jgi:hypothetical protein